MSKRRMSTLEEIGTTSAHRCRHKVESILRRQDIFGSKVEFTYKGKHSYQTNIGACVSILVLVILGFFIAYELVTVIQRKDPAVMINEVVANADASENGFNPFLERL